MKLTIYRDNERIKMIRVGSYVFDISEVQNIEFTTKVLLETLNGFKHDEIENGNALAMEEK